MTAGWNDPRAAPTYSDKPIDNSMRINRKKKKTTANIIPEDVKGFVPAPQPVNQPMGMGGMMGGAPPMMGGAPMGIPPANMGAPPPMMGGAPVGQLGIPPANMMAQGMPPNPAA